MQKKHPKRNNWFLEYIFLNIFVFAGIGLLSLVVFNVSVFNPFTQAFSDFTLTDLYYSKTINQNKIYDKDLILVSVENRSREEIAYLIHRIEEGKPKVLGMDVIFKERIDSSDEILRQEIALHKNIIFPHIAQFDSLTTEQGNDTFFNAQSNAYVNLIGESREFTTIRYYRPMHNNMPAFTTAVMQMFDSTKAQKLLDLGEKKTEIRYYGNLQNFRYNTFSEVMKMDFDVSVFKDKIILLGYMGLTPRVTRSTLDEDRFYTPLNPRLSGRSHPDMYGIVIHANIIRMALDGDYIVRLPAWLNYLIAFCLSLMLIPMYLRWYVNRSIWYHLNTVLVGFSISILFVFLTILLYAKANIKIESAAVLVSVVFLTDFIFFYDTIMRFLKHKLGWNIKSIFIQGAKH